jgi:hypothetical protein
VADACAQHASWVAERVVNGRCGAHAAVERQPRGGRDMF